MEPQDFYNSNDQIDKIDSKLINKLAAYNQYVKKLKDNGIIFHIINQMNQCKYVQIQKSALGEYVKYSVSYGYIELTLSVYIVQLGAKNTAKFKNFRSQINGIQYQVLPFHPVLYKYYICRAVQCKILRILFVQQNKQGQIKDKNYRQRFDLIINSQYQFCFIPTITLSVSSLKGFSKASNPIMGFIKKDYDEKYLAILGKVEFYLSKVLHFMNILGITNYLSFIMVDKNIGNQVTSHQYRIQQNKLEIYITAAFSSIFIYQEDFMNNFLHPYTYILSINSTNFIYHIHTPRHPIMKFSQLSQIYLSSTFDLLAEFYLEKDTGKMVKLCIDNKWSQLTQGNKNLVIGLLSWLYEIIDHKKYLKISQVLLTASKIRLQSSGISKQEHIINCNKILGDKQNQSLGLKHKKQQSNTKNMGWKNKKNISSQISEDESSDIDSCQQISGKITLSQHSQFDQYKISYFQDTEIKRLEEKNCNYLLGQQYEYLVNKKYCKLSNKMNKTSKIFQQQKTRVFQTEFVHLVYRNIQASKYKDLYISVKQSINLGHIFQIKQQNITVNPEDIANNIQIIKKLSIFLAVEPISTILNFIRHQTCCSQKVDIQNEINFLIVQTYILIQKCQQNGLRLVQCIGNKILSGKQERISGNQQIQVIKGWQLLIQILMIHIRYENSIPTLFIQLDKQYQKLWKISQQFIFSCKSDLKQQKQPKIEHLLVYCLWTTYDNILVIIKVLINNTHYLKFPTWAWQMVSSNLKKNKQFKLLLKINKSKNILYNIVCQIFRMIIEFEDLYLKMQMFYQIALNEEYQKICDCVLPDHLINTLLLIQEFQTIQVNNCSGSVFFGFICASYDYLQILISHVIQKTTQKLSPFQINNSKFAFLAKYTIFSKQTLSWICKCSSYLQDILPDTTINMRYLQECAHFFKNPAFQLVYFKYDRCTYLHPTFRAEQFEHLIDFLKTYVSTLQNNGQSLSCFSLLVVAILISFAFNDSQFYQYKLEIQLILKEMLYISIKHHTKYTNIFIDLILPTLNRMKNYPKLLNLVLQICYNQIQIIQLQTKRLKQNQLMIKHYQQIEIKQNSFRDDFHNKYFQWLISQYQLENKQQSNSFQYLAPYFALKKIVFQLNELNKKIYLLAKSVEQKQIAKFQIKFYETLVETKLRFCWNTSYNIKQYCKSMNFLLPSKQILQKAQQYYDYKDLKKDRQLSFNNFLVFLDKNFLQQSKNWITDLQKRYCSSIKFNKNQEYYLLPYIHQIGYKYYDNLSDGRLKNNEYILFIGVQYLKHHKKEISKIGQNWKLLQQICIAFSQHCKKYLKHRTNYVIANLHYITAELSQIKNDWKKSKIQIKKMEKYQKFNNQIRFKFLPIINFYHKIHKMFEKFANQKLKTLKQKKEIYRFVCPICPNVQKINFQFTKPLQKIAQKIRIQKYILTSQQFGAK